MTPILHAAHDNHFETVFDLIELGADITISNVFSQRLVDYTAGNG